jgi:hypothetical protein
VVIGDEVRIFLGKGSGGQKKQKSKGKAARTHDETPGVRLVEMKSISGYIIMKLIFIFNLPSITQLPRMEKSGRLEGTTLPCNLLATN